MGDTSEGIAVSDGRPAVTYPRRPPPPPCAYALHEGTDGLIYVYNAGEQESRYGIRPANATVRDSLDALVKMLNDKGKPHDLPLTFLAYQIMLKIW